MIHRFGHAEGVGDEAFDSVMESYRSDIEQRNTPLALHDPDSVEIRLARNLADEVINVSGAELKVFVRTENGDFDAVWDEDPDPTYWNPMLIKGIFKPKPIEVELKKWGAEAINKTEVFFTHRQIYNLLGNRMLRTGDVIQVPFNATPISPKNYRILNATPSGQFRYVWLYLTCTIETLTADISVRPEEDMVEEDQIRTGGQYRESL